MNPGKAGRLERWKQQAGRLHTELHALTLAYRDPRTPWAARLAAVLVVAYAFSPIDLIPDFIPLLGLLDDLILLPLGIRLALRLIPADVMADCRRRARESSTPGTPLRWGAAAAVLTLWLLLAGWVVLTLVRLPR